MDGIHSMQILYKGDNGELLFMAAFYYCCISLFPLPAQLLQWSVFVCEMKVLPPMELLPQLSI